MFQVNQAGSKLPEDLKNFLTVEGHHFCGAHISLDVERLEIDYGVTPSNTHDHQLIVPTVCEDYTCLLKGGEIGEFRSSLLDIANKVLHLSMKKTKFDHMRWAERDLTKDQVEYAAIDAYLSYAIAHRIMIEHGYVFR